MAYTPLHVLCTIEPCLFDTTWNILILPKNIDQEILLVREETSKSFGVARGVWHLQILYVPLHIEN